MFVKYKVIFFIIISIIFPARNLLLAEDYYLPSNLHAMPNRKSNYYNNTISYGIENQNHPDKEKINAICEDAINEGIPGIIILIDTKKNGTWVSAKGKIDLKNNIPIQKNSLSRIGSITKMYTAVAVYRLIEEGLLSLDTTVSTYMDKKTLEGIPNADTITIRELLNHTSGLPNYTDYFNVLELYTQNSNLELTSLNALNMIKNVPSDFKPGSKCFYSNTNYILLGLIAEKVAKKSMKYLYEEMIFKPLGLQSTYYDPENPVKLGVARGYVNYPTGNIIDTTDFDQAERTPDGGIVSNVYDMMIFIKALLQDQTLLAYSEYDQMINNLHVDEKIGCEDGAGILRINIMNDIFAYGYSGGHFGYTAELWFTPKTQKIIVCLINGSNLFGTYVEPIKKLRRWLFKYLLQN